MKLSEFAKPAIAAPVSPRAANSEPDAVASAPQEPQGTTEITPNGTEVYYQSAKKKPQQRRLYRVNGVEFPSVTKVLEVLGKDLTNWAQRVAIEGVMALHNDGRSFLVGDTVDDWMKLLAERKLSADDVRDFAADRGSHVHNMLERWVGGESAVYDDYAEDEQGFVRALDSFLKSLEGNISDVQSEIMVGSVEHRYAGRFDLALTLDRPVEVISMRYKAIEIPAGRWLMDLKTRKGGKNYKTDFLQLEAYEAAAVECGYEPTDHRAVVITAPDGRYRFLPNQDWCFDDFLAVRRCHTVLNEREVLRVLREELGAKEVK